MEDEASGRHKEAVNAAQSRPGVEDWPLKDTQDHNLFKIYMVRIFGYALRQRPARRGLDSAKVA